MMPAFRACLALVALVAVLVAASACAAPLQNGGVEMRPGAEARLDLLCRYRAGGGQSVCDGPAQDE